MTLQPLLDALDLQESAARDLAEHPDYPRILTVFNQATGPLRAKEVCEALGHELLPKNVEGTACSETPWSIPATAPSHRRMPHWNWTMAHRRRQAEFKLSNYPSLGNFTSRRSPRSSHVRSSLSYDNSRPTRGSSSPEGVLMTRSRKILATCALTLGVISGMASPALADNGAAVVPRPTQTSPAENSPDFVLAEIPQEHGHSRG
ncbi:hypothetical protein [Streptomyces sp. NPDC059850]|uniref:hypothetical protein n=1 Tax=Streptomyces sp. NPDC059850 TaxID=3346970 RepID=UPI003651C1FF